MSIEINNVNASLITILLMENVLNANQNQKIKIVLDMLYNDQLFILFSIMYIYSINVHSENL